MLELVRDGHVQAVASWGLAEEIVEVLRRPRLRRYRITERDISDVLVLLAPLLPDVDIEVETHDRSDVPVVSAALAGAADIIVTGDRGLLEDADLGSWLEQRGVGLQRPAEFVDRFGA
jgi:putative PIN family toxin of toxin-antitoxin system